MFQFFCSDLVPGQKFHLKNFLGVGLGRFDEIDNAF
jgi:hypothetical protein